MGEWRSETMLSEPAGCETLYMKPRWLPDGAYDVTLYVAAVLDDDMPTVSIAALTSYEGRSGYGHVWLTLEEADLLIATLEEAKARLHRCPSGREPCLNCDRRYPTLSVR